ncbi:SDR family NAD(P)-dependent oxidoreductase [Mycolicibacterium mengxianglii]|uniref:SDR family NAD(P)-dependent oxidoreductase n=1 Tax=Mycolicibacterium mengxianglii TaxID=2736649 RepID=UPI0038CBF943
MICAHAGDPSPRCARRLDSQPNGTKLEEDVSDLTGKTALVTGATSGIGLAAAHALVKGGAYVFLVGRRQDALEDAVAGIGADQSSFIRADVTEQSDLDRGRRPRPHPTRARRAGPMASPHA